MTEPSIGSWSDVATLLRERPTGTLLRVPKGWLEHPKAFGMKACVGLPLGQTNDFWKRLDDTTLTMPEAGF